MVLQLFLAPLFLNVTHLIAKCTSLSTKCKVIPAGAAQKCHQKCSLLDYIKHQVWYMLMITSLLWYYSKQKNQKTLLIEQLLKLWLCRCTETSLNKSIKIPTKLTLTWITNSNSGLEFLSIPSTVLYVVEISSR